MESLNGTGEELLADAASATDEACEHLACLAEDDPEGWRSLRELAVHLQALRAGG